jgi:hypothetical protein
MLIIYLNDIDFESLTYHFIANMPYFFSVKTGFLRSERVVSLKIQWTGGGFEPVTLGDFTRTTPFFLDYSMRELLF